MNNLAPEDVYQRMFLLSGTILSIPTCETVVAFTRKATQLARKTGLQIEHCFEKVEMELGISPGGPLHHAAQEFKLLVMRNWNHSVIARPGKNLHIRSVSSDQRKAA